MYRIGIYCMTALFVLTVQGFGQSIDFENGSALQYRGNIGYQQWYYPREGTAPNQPDFVSTVKGALFLTYQLSETPVEFIFNSRFVYDPEDTSLEKKGVQFMGAGRNRMLVDDLYLDALGETMEFRVGYQIFSWKTVESVSWADFLNQVDRQGDLLDPDKIGELAARARFISPLGDESTLEFFYLPWFTPGTNAQPGSRSYVMPITNDYNAIEYGSSKKRIRPQGALKFSSSMFEEIDYSLFYFHGYDRNMFVTFNPNQGLRQKYELMHRGGLTFQGTVEDWLIKGEAIVSTYENNSIDPFGAGTFGIEYTFNSLFIQNHDIGLITEVIATSDFGKDPATLPSFRPFNNHLFAGVRYTFNNTSDRSFLIGAFNNMSYYEMLVSAKYNERILELFTLEIEAMAVLAEEASMLKQLEHLARIDAELQWNF